MPYKVYVSLKSDMNEGWVWITHPEVPSRSIIEITNNNKQKVFCEALQIDHNYRKEYKTGRTYPLTENEAVITLNSWYRNKLGITATNEYCNLTIKPANHLFGKFRATIGHPQIIIRLATWLGIISVALGFISFI
ncbi:hypothetical protein [Oceanobacter sp. 3_MG-2023]|uniref:hypothetical protein n=1 Tax=Oceanobacter sp. 3_MG-2023 TaxID=3062622 RepID=UPI0027323BA1|nr:hypothetical protein [Oceanobacter sp. 3_MG-2023]MDP2506957.1 hypothetical protein [Oceanobacter sp. 3_MG-2023]